MVGLGGVAAWYAAKNFIRGYANRAPTTNAMADATPGPPVAPWEQDVLEYFDEAGRQAKGGNIIGAEVQVDQAVAEMEEARVRSEPVQENFFGRVSTKLDGILKAPAAGESAVQNPDATSSAHQIQARGADPVAARLFQHVTQARIELAAMRSWQESMPTRARLAVSVAEDAVDGRVVKSTRPDLASALSVSASGKLTLPAGHVDVEAPRELSKGDIFGPTSLHANFLDASLMPDTSEILMPPESRRLSDNVRVENLTIAGASQTLGGIHWRNVTFIETRVRYEDGGLDLHNVHFIHCTFGFPSDARGAAIANMIALGNASLTIR